MAYGPPIDDPVQPTTAPGIEPGSDIGEVLRQLLSGLETVKPPAPPAPPQPIGGIRNVLGSVGDALLNAASVRAGGGVRGPGPFAQMLQKRAEAARAQAEDYQKMAMAAETSNVETRNRIRAQIALENMRQTGRKDVAEIKAEAKPPVLKDFVRRVGNQNRMVRQIVDPNTMQVQSEQDLGLSPNQPEDKTTAPTKPSIVYDKTGKAFWAYPPDKENPQGILQEAGFSKAANQAEAGMPEALNNAEYLLDKMQSHYDKAVLIHNPVERTAISGPASSKSQILSGPAGYFDPDAAIHERNRHMVAVALAAPLTGSRRGQVQVIQHIADGLPKYSDNPKVADEFYKQMHAVIANLRRAYPSGIPKNDAGDAVYLSELDDAINLARENAKAVAAGKKPTMLPVPANPTSTPENQKNKAVLDDIFGGGS